VPSRGPGEDSAGPDRPWAVMDLDGVVADVRHRLPLLHAPGGRSGRGRWRPDWAAFFAGAGDDPVLEEGRAVAERLARDHDVVYLSGRPEHLRTVTERWLQTSRLPAGRLLLRPSGDRRPARLLKREVVRRLARERPVGVVVDDDAEVAAALRAAGFPVLLADWGAAPEDQARGLRAAQEDRGAT
jgi:hypothetical protein